MKFWKALASFVLLVCIYQRSYAQDFDLMKIVDDNQVKKKEYTFATFKSTRAVNLHTSEVLGRRALDFRIAHRFSALNTGAYNAWGIDGPVNIQLSLEYSYDGRLMFGLARSSQDKMVDVFLKYRLIRQTIDGKTPFSVTWFSGMYYNNTNLSAGGPSENMYANSTNRLSYVHQLIIARKFNSNFSFQISPTYVHYNIVNLTKENNDSYSMGFVTRIKYSKRAAIVLEYVLRLSTYSPATYYDSMGIGWEIETGGHVFSVHLTNSLAIAENEFIPYTNTSWSGGVNGGVRLGFNISRVFAL